MVGAGVIGLVLTLLIIGIVFIALSFIIKRFPSDDPDVANFKKWAVYGVLVLCIIWACYVLIGFSGYGVALGSRR